LLLRPLEQYIPFISRQAVVAPPIPGRSPRPGKVDNLSVNTSLLAPGTDLRRLALLNLDQCSQWRTKHPKTQRRLPIASLSPPFTKIRFRNEGEVFHAERVGTMSVEQSW